MTRTTITIETDVYTPAQVLYAGVYLVELPVTYDPALITGEDILLDAAITVVERAECTEPAGVSR